MSSATVDAEYIRDFFGGKAGVLSVHGTAYSVEVFYLEKPCPDYVKGCVDTVLKLHATEPPGDVIVFLTGMDEVDHCVSLLKGESKLYIPSTLNIDLILWHAQLNVCV